MGISVHESRLMELLKSELQETALPEKSLEEHFQALTPEDWNGMMNIAQVNRVFPLLLDALRRNPSIPVPMPVGRFLEQFAFQNSIGFYQKVFLLSSLVELLRQENITAYLLKGLCLNSLYPHAESRCFGDIDLYIPDRQDYERLQAIFESRGYQREPGDMTDYHHGYQYVQEKLTCVVELHYRLTASWQTGDFDQKLAKLFNQALTSQLPRDFEVMELRFQTLPVTMEALYLLMHMFQHFMNKGFGLRLFADWVVFWRKLGDQVDQRQFSRWVKELGLDAFADAVDSVCVRYFGMELPAFGWFRGWEDGEIAQELLEDVFQGGEFGHLDRDRISVTSRRAGTKAYLMELHRQTKKRFPRASRVKVLLPVLWAAAAVVFQFNNWFRRRISLRRVLETTKKRNKLAKKMHIFDES